MLIFEVLDNVQQTALMTTAAKADYIMLKYVALANVW